MKHINIVDALYLCRIDRVTDLLITVPVLEVSSIKVEDHAVIISIVDVDSVRTVTTIDRLYNSRIEAEKQCITYNKSLWKQS